MNVVISLKFNQEVLIQSFRDHNSVYLWTPGYYVHKHNMFIPPNRDSAEWQAERRPVKLGMRYRLNPINCTFWQTFKTAKPSKIPLIWTLIAQIIVNISETSHPLWLENLKPSRYLLHVPISIVFQVKSIGDAICHMTAMIWRRQNSENLLKCLDSSTSRTCSVFSKQCSLGLF